MDNNEEWSWILFVYGGLLLAGLAISTFIVAVICSVAAGLGKYPQIPVVLYWTHCFVGILFLIFGRTEFSCVVTFLATPFHIILFWYYDRIKAKMQSQHLNDEHGH